MVIHNSHWRSCCAYLCSCGFALVDNSGLHWTNNENYCSVELFVGPNDSSKCSSCNCFRWNRLDRAPNRTAGNDCSPNWRTVCDAWVANLRVRSNMCRRVPCDSSATMNDTVVRQAMPVTLDLVWCAMHGDALCWSAHIPVRRQKQSNEKLFSDLFS